MNSSTVTFDDIPSLQGRRFVGETFSLTVEDIARFEHATWVDRAYPADGPSEFPKDIVEGFFSLSLIDALARFTFPFDGESCWGLNYGLDRVRFIAPFFAGDEIRPEFEIREVRPKGPGYLVLRHCTLTSEGADRPGMVADWWAYVLPRGTTMNDLPR